MAFTNTKTSKGRTGIIVAVAALHGVAIYGLITGLGIDYIKETIANLPTREYPSEPPPPEPAPPQEKTKPDEPELRAPKPDVVLPRTDDTLYVPIQPKLPLPHDPFGPDIVDVPPPAPAFDPVRATPKTSPGSWFSPNDYPTRDIRQGNEGTAHFLLTIDARGKVSGCEITRSTGFPGLDKVTCQNAVRHGSFDPARDENGKRVAGSYAGKITWVIPD